METNGENISEGDGGPHHIGQRVRSRREELNYSLRRAQEISGINHKTWARIELGKSGPTRGKTADAICETLGWKIGTFNNPVLKVEEPFEVRLRLLEDRMSSMAADLGRLTSALSAIADVVGVDSGDDEVSEL